MVPDCLAVSLSKNLVFDMQPPPRIKQIVKEHELARWLGCAPQGTRYGHQEVHHHSL